MREITTRRVWLVASLLLLGSVGPSIAGEACDLEYDDAEFFIEINATDGDVGFHAKMDGDAWKVMHILRPEDDEVIFRDLERADRVSIPVNLVYPADPTKPAILLEELIGPDDALLALYRVN